MESRAKLAVMATAAWMLSGAQQVWAEAPAAPPVGEATKATKDANAAVASRLALQRSKDSERAAKGKIAEIKADAIRIQQSDRPDGGTALRWNIAGDAASPLQFLCTDGRDRFLRGALYFELRPNADSLAPVVARLGQDVEHLLNQMAWR